MPVVEVHASLANETIVNKDKTEKIKGISLLIFIQGVFPPLDGCLRYKEKTSLKINIYVLLENKISKVFRSSKFKKAIK